MQVADKLQYPHIWIQQQLWEILRYLVFERFIFKSPPPALQKKLTQNADLPQR